MSRLIAMAGLASYIARSRLDHDGKSYPPGAAIKLETEAAQELIDIGAIGHAEQSGATELQVSIADGQAQRVRALEAALDGSEQALQVARSELEAANASLAELTRAATSDQAAITLLQSEVSAAKDANVELQNRLDGAELAKTELQVQLDKATADLTAATAGKTKTK